MWRATIKGVFAYKLRLALTGMAVVLGVAFVVGTFVLTDTLTGFFDDVFSQANAKIDWVVGPRADTQGSDRRGPGVTGPQVPPQMLEAVRRVPGVDTVEANVSGFAQMLDKSGKPIGGLGPPTLAFSYPEHAELSPLRLKSGHPPSGPNEVVIDAVTARRFNYNVGDHIRIIPHGPVQQFTIAGVVGFGSRDNLGGATIVAWDLPTTQRMLGHEGLYDGIGGTIKPGANLNQVINAISEVLPDNLEARTGAQAAADNADQIKSGISALSTALLAFGGIALFVGAFIIANTFSIIVAQRARELALLRSLGASRTQILVSVLAEAAIVGLAAAAIGVVVGLGIGAGLRALLNSFNGGGSLPGATIALRPRTIIVGLLVGSVTTVASAIAPAIRGCRQAPVAALQTAVLPPPAKVSLRRLLTGGVGAVVGIAFVGWGLFGHNVRLRFAVLAVGTLATFLGIAFLSPLAARPLAQLLGRPIARAYGITGRLARQNAARNPQRTAATSAALMIGLALVAAVATMGASIKRSVDALFDQSVRAQVIVDTRQENGFDPSVEPRVRSTEGVAAAVPLRYNRIDVDGHPRRVVAAPGELLAKVVDVGVIQGSLGDLANGGIALHKDVAANLGKKVGDSVTLKAGANERAARVRAIFKDNQFVANYVVALPDYEALVTEQLDQVLLATTTTDAKAGEVAKRLGAALATDYPQLRVKDQVAFRKDSAAQVNPLLVVVNALLLLSVIIALLGITNTLALSVFERTRELGLLRAVGMSRRQTRRMVRWESVIIAVIGAILGVALGLVFGAAIVQSLRDDGVTRMVIPAPTMVTMVLLAGVAGMGAAIFPARRAARLDILQAIATD